jgi:hypothetical protein
MVEPVALSGGDARCGGSSTIPAGRWYDFGIQRKAIRQLIHLYSDYKFDYLSCWR